MGVDELVGKQAAVFVVENGFEFVCAGSDINLVVDGQQFAGRDLGSVVAIVRFHRQLSGPLVQLIKDLWELILRQGEDHGDRLNLGDDQQSAGIGGVNDIAGID